MRHTGIKDIRLHSNRSRTKLWQCSKISLLVSKLSTVHTELLGEMKVHTESSLVTWQIIIIIFHDDIIS